MAKRSKLRPKKKFLSWLDSHHRLERTFLSTMFSGALLITSFVYSTIHNNDVIYRQSLLVSPAGQTIPFSKSVGTSMTLGASKLSSDQKTAFVPMSFNSMAQIGIEAKNYKFYILDGSNGTMKYRLTGRFFLYPVQKKGVLILTSPVKIANEPLMIAMMNNKKVSTYGNQDEDNNINQSAGDGQQINYGNHDALSFKINPGAKNILNSSRVDPNTISLKSVYVELFGKPAVQKIQQKIASDNAKIKKYTLAAQGLIQRLRNEGYIVPKDPYWLNPDWTSKYKVNPKTGRTESGDQLPQNMTQNLSASPYAQSFGKFADTLKNNEGHVMQETGKGSSQDQADLPINQWRNLQSAWSSIATTKLDIQVTQQLALYDLQKTNNEVNNPSSIGPANGVRQVSQVQN